MADSITIRTSTERDVLKIVERGPQGPAGGGGGGGSGTVTSVALTSSDLTITGSPITTSGTITANLANSGATAGTYTKVTVDAKGRVTAGAMATAADVGADPVTLVTISSGTSYSVVPARRARLLVDRANLNSDVAIILNTESPENGDSVEIFVAAMISGRKATVDTSGFGTFDLYQGQSAVFVYAANQGPARWIKSVWNITKTVPASPSSSGQIGDIASDNNYIYFYVANIWRRVPIANWS